MLEIDRYAIRVLAVTADEWRKLTKGERRAMRKRARRHRDHARTENKRAA